MQKLLEIMSPKKIFLYIFAVYFAIFEVVSGEEDIPSIIIIGAGAAGIAAASKLFEDGFQKVTILEAENRIGGRIHTIEFKKYLVDLGAQFIYEENTGCSHLRKWPYELVESEYHGCNESKIYASSGRRLNDRFSIREPEIKIPIFSDECDSPSRFLERAVRKNIKSNPELKDEEGLRQMILMSDCATYGADMNQVPTKHCQLYDDEPSGEIENWKNRGYSTILDVLMKRYPNPAEEFPIINNTILNTEVSLIQYDLENGKAIVKTTNGNTYCADHVIVTIPLGVLKEKYNTLFHPSLPEKKSGLYRLGFGKQEKMFLFFNKPFWNYTKLVKRDFGFSIYWKDKDRVELERDPERSWLLGLHEFRFVKYKPKLLMSRVSGKYSEDMNKLSDQQVYNHVVEVLKKFFGKDYNAGKPTAVIRSNWNTNKNFRGSWTYYKMREPAEDDVFCQDLTDPLGKNNLTILFAGEATHSCSFGSVGGAISSGFHIAEWITSFYPHLKKNL